MAAVAVAQGCMSHICIAEGSVQRFGQLMSLSEEAGEEIMHMLQAGNPATMERQDSEQRHQITFKVCISGTGLHLVQQEGIYRP